MKRATRVNASAAPFSSRSRESRSAPATVIAPPAGAGRRGRSTFTLWKPEAVQITRGAEHVAQFQKTPRSQRVWCKTCGGHLMTRHPEWGLIDVFAATIPSFPFTPGVHVNMESSVLAIRDGLPKLKDFPKELGGSGAPMPD